MRVVVVGAGVSGLTAARVLAGAGAEVTVLERAVDVGGKLRVASVAGVRVDVGAEAMLARRPEGLALAAELGLTVVHPRTTSAGVRAGGATHPLPTGTVMGVPGDFDALAASGILSAEGLAVVAAEPSRPPLPPLTGDVAIGALVRDRLGGEVVDRLVEPLLGGVYAGRADALSLRAAVPALAARLGEGGSLLDAVAGTPPASSGGPVFASLPGGLAGLTAALAEHLLVETGVTVREIRRDGNGFALTCGSAAASYTRTADAVVVATPAPAAARLLAEVAPDASARLARVELASVAIVTLAFDSAELPAGSGLLVGAREGFAVKGVTLTSQKWPWPDGPVLLRASLGRAGDTRTLQQTDAELTALVRSELAALIGLRATPVDSRVTRWGGGLPQYGVGHLDLVGAAQASVATVPGLAVCGATYAGVGVPACIASGRAAAARVLGGAE